MIIPSFPLLLIAAFEVNNKAVQSIAMMEPLNTNNISFTAVSPLASIGFF